MTAIPNRLYVASQVRELDRVAIEEHGIAGFDLMQRAAEAAFDVLRDQWPMARKIHVFCGGGNNGGDGLLIAALAMQAGLSVTVELLVAPDKLQGDAALAYEKFIEVGGALSSSPNEEEQADVLVDALLGTGVSREVEGDFLAAIQRINASAVPVLSVDIPSGLSADTGEVLGEAVRATVTMSFIGQKIGCFTGRGPAFAGERLFDTLAVPEAIYAAEAPVASIMTDELRLDLLPRRERDAHKNRFGHVLCVGGDYGTAGAIRLSAEAALRSGAGLVSVATRPEVATAMSQACPELMCVGVASPLELDGLLKAATVVVIGPGLGQSSWAQALMSYVLQTHLPLVVDADALNLLARQPEKRLNWVLTPHPGEAARLLGKDKSMIQADRLASVSQLCLDYGSVSLLKGAGSLIAAPDADVHLCAQGNPGMAVGGMGDLLSGMVAAFIAQGLSCLDATRLAVYVHALAGDRAAMSGERGMLPRDLLSELRSLVNP